MEYKKIAKENYNIHIINYNKFKTVNTHFVFSSFFNMKEKIYLSLLAKVLITSSKKYNTNKKISIRCEELYNSMITAANSHIGNIIKIDFIYDYINPKYIDGNINETLDFFMEIIFNPNIENKLFDENTFELCKENLISRLKSIKEDANLYGYIKFSENLYEKIESQKNLYNYIDEIEKITNKDLYDFYKKMINTYKIDIFILGEIESEEEYIKYYENKLSKLKNKFSSDLEIDVVDNIGKEKYKELKSNFDTTNLYIGYSFNGLSEFERDYVLNMYSHILGGINNNLLFETVREKNSLCYSIASYINKYPTRLWIETEIDINNKDKVIKLIDECQRQMMDKKIISSLINGSKETIMTSLNTFYDDKNIIIENYYKNEFIETSTIEEKKEKYNSIKPEDIINLNSKISKYVTFVLKGKEE